MRSICFLLAVSVSLVICETIFTGKAKIPYEVKRSWVDNFIKFQQIQEGKQKKPKIVPVGCVPSNSLEGDLLKVNETLKTRDFLYACVQTEDGVVSYEAIACFDEMGRPMKIGQARIKNNGTIIEKCENNMNGVVAKSVETAFGCMGKRAVYFEDAEWVQVIEEGEGNGLLTGRWMKCFRPHNGYYESHVIGCSSDKTLVKTGDYADLGNGKYVKCVEEGRDNVKLVEVEKKELNCTSADGKVYGHDDVWMDEERGAEMTCKNGGLEKTGCLLSSTVLPIGQEIRISLGHPEYCVFMCQPHNNIYVCDRKLGNYTIIQEPDNSTVINTVSLSTEKNVKSVEIPDEKEEASSSSEDDNEKIESDSKWAQLLKKLNF